MHLLLAVSMVVKLSKTAGGGLSWAVVVLSLSFFNLRRALQNEPIRTQIGAAAAKIAHDLAEKVEKFDL